MGMNWRKTLLGTGLALGALMVEAPQFAQAQEAAPAEEPVEMKVSGTLNLDWNSHFVSYGFDVWSGGRTWGKSTFNPSAQLNFDFDVFTLYTGTWWDVNSNTTSAIGGQLQEVDVWWGIAVPIADFTVSITYQDWMYASQVERILDGAVAYNDSALWGGDFALNPSVTFHQRLSGDGLEDHLAVVVGIAPGFTLLETEDLTINLSVPVSAGFFEGDFHGGSDSGFGFLSVGLAFSTPLTFVPAQYGAWTLNYGITYYHTEEDVIPNDSQEFFTGRIGLSLSF